MLYLTVDEATALCRDALLDAGVPADQTETIADCIMYASARGVDTHGLVSILPATLVDPVVFRGILRVFHMLDAPETLARDPEMLVRSIPMLARVLLGSTPRKPFEPIRRADALARIGVAV